MRSWNNLARRRRLKVLGLMSGTSCDGVSCALITCRRTNGLSLTVDHWRTYPYPEKLRKILLEITSLGPKELASLNQYLGNFFGKIANRFRRDCDQKIDMIGSHGHTVVHCPPSPDNLFHCAASFQIGEAAQIARITGLPLVADFRCADIAAGGQGAPLVPFFDHITLRQPNTNVLALNLGGIANLTLVTWCSQEVVGFDTGPGNVLCDWLIGRKNGQSYDKGGKLALQGRIDKNLIKKMLQDPFFHIPPPKSIDRSFFTGYFAEQYLGPLMGKNVKNALATLAAFTAESIFCTVEKFIDKKIDLILAAGGGTHNKAIMQSLTNCFGMPVQTTDSLGIAVEAREAAAFALMAACAVWEIPNHLPQVTGADRAGILGKLVFV